MISKIRVIADLQPLFMSQSLQFKSFWKFMPVMLSSRKKYFEAWNLGVGQLYLTTYKTRRYTTFLRKYKVKREAAKNISRLSQI